MAVFSGYRFVLRAAEKRMPIAIVNLDVARGDDDAVVRLNLPLGRALPQIARALTRAR
jgi:NAD+-dependent protein deacetylase sirtuin 4